HTAAVRRESHDRARDRLGRGREPGLARRAREPSDRATVRMSSRYDMAPRKNSVTEKLRALGRRSGVYVLSLPERTLRSVSALAGVCGFGRQLIPEIADELKKAGLLDASRSFATMEQLLGGLEGSAAQLAETVNVPPLDVAGLREEWGKLVTEVKRLPTPQLPSPASVRRLWSELRAEAAAQ